MADDVGRIAIATDENKAPGEAVNWDGDAINAETNADATNHEILGTSSGTLSETSSKLHRKRNKPSLSCELCTVSWCPTARKAALACMTCIK